MKLFTQVFGVLFTSVIAAGAMCSSASAQVAEAPVPNGAVGWCSIEATLKVTSLHAIVGFTEGHGTGVINCQYTDGGKEIIPIQIRTNLHGVGAGFSVKTATLVASGIGLQTFGGSGLAGHYGLASASVELIAVGADAGISLTANRDGFSIPLTLQGNIGSGLEGSADIGEMDIQIVPPSQQMLPAR